MLIFLKGTKKKKKNSDMVAHTCNPSTQELRQENLKLEANLGYTARLSQKMTPNQAKLNK
jgi:hypothetical protein